MHSHILIVLTLSMAQGHSGPFSDVPSGWAYSPRKGVDSWVSAYIDSYSNATLLVDIGRAHVMEPVSTCAERAGSILGTFGQQPYCAVDVTDARAYELRETELKLNDGHPFTQDQLADITRYLPESGTSLLAVWMEFPDHRVGIVSVFYCSVEQRTRVLQFLQHVQIRP